MSDSGLSGKLGSPSHQESTKTVKDINLALSVQGYDVFLPYEPTEHGVPLDKFIRFQIS